MSDDDARATPAPREGWRWGLVLLGLVVIAVWVHTALAPRVPAGWRPHSELGYGPTLAYPLVTYPLALVVVGGALSLVVRRAGRPRSRPLIAALATVAALLVALFFGADSLLGPAHLSQYRGECAAGSVSGCIAVSECAPSREERMEALEHWYAIDATWGGSALGGALLRSVDWPETPAAERDDRIARGLGLLDHACESGAPNACDLLSGVYRSGRLVPRDDARADGYWQTGEHHMQRGR